jgi:hypothetical protein
MRTTERRSVAWGEGWMLPLGAMLAWFATNAGCSSSQGTSGTGAQSGGGGAGMTSGTDGGVSPSSNSGSAVNLQGGAAPSSGGRGQNGGLVHLVAQGDISFDATMAPPSTMIPAPPASAMAVTSSALASDVTITGDAVVAGGVSSGGSDPVRKLSASGDIYVTGTLQGADLGSARQGLDLEAGGNIYVSGSLDAGGAAGQGQAAGSIRLVAKSVVVTGQVTSAGGDGTSSGGNAGALTVQASGDVLFDGKVLLNGGAAAGSGSAQGGTGAKLTIDSNGSVALGGTVDAQGGTADSTASGGNIVGGIPGELHVGESAPPTSISIFAPVIVSGGPGGASAGTGGTITPEPATGDVNIAGPLELDLRGGDSASAPGTGGLLNGGGRTDPGSGGVHITGEIDASGGSITTGGSGNGADGGRVDMELTPTDGAVTIDGSAKITVRGGGSGGAGTAGGGGHVWFFTKDGDETISGTIDVSGGDAPNPGGIGGKGGMIYFLSDNNHNGVEVCRGNLWVTQTGVLIASGGNGDTGGNGRSTGIPGTVASFPDHQEEIAIFLNCDAEHGNTCNWMQNDGRLVAQGGAHNGKGGDVVYHGIPPGVLGTPSAQSGDYPTPAGPGTVDTAGDGSGMSGTFEGE